jgi:hypothetical protein
VVDLEAVARRVRQRGSSIGDAKVDVTEAAHGETGYAEPFGATSGARHRDVFATTS